MSEGTVDFDESRWPIVVVTFRGALGAAGVAKLFAETERLMARREPHILISDLSEITELANSKIRQEITEWTARMETEYGHSAVTSIKVVRSALVRGAISAVQWMRGREQKDLWVASLSEALETAELERIRLGL